MNQTTVHTGFPDHLEPARVSPSGATPLETVGRIVSFGRLAFCVLKDAEVRDAWRSASGDVYRAIEPTKRAVSAVLAAGRVTIAAWAQHRG